jgi:hypothetical protein
MSMSLYNLVCLVRKTFSLPATNGEHTGGKSVDILAVGELEIKLRGIKIGLNSNGQLPKFRYGFEGGEESANLCCFLEPFGV